MKQVFQVYGFSRVKKGNCVKCGKKCQKTKCFEQTINPWNKKTSEQIMSEEKEKADKWLKESIVCRDCE